MLPIGCYGSYKKTITLKFDEDKIKILPYNKKHRLEISLPYKSGRYLIPKNIDEATNWLIEGLPNDYIDQLISNNNKGSVGLGWKDYAGSSYFAIADYIYKIWNLDKERIKTKICSKEKITLSDINEEYMTCDFIILDCMETNLIGGSCSQ